MRPTLTIFVLLLSVLAGAVTALATPFFDDL